MAVLLALVTAALYGVGDFCGGLSAKRAEVVQVVAGSHLVGLVGVAAAAPFLADAFTARDALLGAVGGVFGGIGVALLYRRLAQGPMAVVAPLTAMTSAAVPAIWGVATGDVLSGWAWIGVVLALVAIGLVSSVRDGSAAPVTASVILESLASGVGFGTFFIFLDATTSATAPWPVVTARLVTATVLITFLVARRREVVPPEPRALGLIALVGLFDTGSNITFLYATQEGALTIVGVISSLYPVGTVLLARLVLAERMTRPQRWGFVVAMAATILIASG